MQISHLIKHFKVYPSIMVEKRLYIRQFILSEYLKGHNAYDAKENICNHIHPNAVSQSTVTHWYGLFEIELN
jgi:hypothetical protein